MAEDRLIEVISPQSYEAIQKLNKELLAAFDNTQKWNKELQQTKGLMPSELKKAYSETTTALNTTRKALTDYEKTERKLELAQKRQMEATSSLNKQIQKRRFETRELNKAAKEDAILTSKIASEYQKLEVRMNKAGRAIQSLIAKKAMNGKLSKKEELELRRLQSQYGRYHNAIVKADYAIKRHNRNVGNYSSSLGGLGRNLRMVMGAFGIYGGIYLFANAMKDAFKRVKDFDKSMQNLAGVMRTNRAGLKDLEQTIIAVAGASVRTSNEVAKLAESLATLGKSKDEIKDLLKPVIDLSLGLDTPAAEVGEFLVQMLNAFGKSTDSAMEFADTITSIRTSTTLDFQKMRDSFAYIAPISRLLNKDLAWTGSVVGILADNSIKAQQAGRLMSTSLIKLAKDGNTLDSALKEVNDAIKEGKTDYELLSIAGDLFGAQAAKIGAILAVNTDLIELNSEALRDNAGATEDLVKQQLESMDAKLLLLDSSYERFILTMDKGDGAISGYMKRNIDSLSNSFNRLSIAMEKGTGFWEATMLRMESMSVVFRQFYFLGLMPVNDALDENLLTNDQLEKAVSKASKAIQKQNEAFIEQHGSLAPLSEMQQEVIKNQERINRVFGGLMYFDDGSESRTLNAINEEIKEYTKKLGEIPVWNSKLIKSTQAKIKELEKERDAILGVSKATVKARKEQMKAMEGSIAHFNALIKNLEEQRDKTAKTNKEYEEFNRKINKIKHSVALLNGEWQKWLKSLQVKPELLKDIKEGIKGNTDELIILSKELDRNAAKRQIELDNLRKSTEFIQEAFFKLGASLGIQQDTLSELFKAGKDGFKDLGDSALAFGNLATDVLMKLAARQNAQIEDQITRLGHQKEVELAFAGDSASARAEIEERFARKTALLKRRQAENEKKAAVTSAMINTAVAVTKVLAELGFAGLAVAAIVAALGAAEVAIIASRPIPQFKEGVKNFEGGRAIVGDGGKHEPITDSAGRLIGVSPRRSTLVDLPKGSNVYRDIGTFERELNGILGGSGISPLGNAANSPIVVYHGSDTKGMTAAEMKKIMDDTLGSMPRNVLTFDENGFNGYAQKQYSKGISLNSRVNFKGINV